MRFPQAVARVKEEQVLRGRNVGGLEDRNAHKLLAMIEREARDTILQISRLRRIAISVHDARPEPPAIGGFKALVDLAPSKEIELALGAAALPTLRAGQVFQAVEMASDRAGVLRVRAAEGWWASVVADDGARLLEPATPKSRQALAARLEKERLRIETEREAEQVRLIWLSSLVCF